MSPDRPDPMTDVATRESLTEMLRVLCLSKQQRLPKPYYQDEHCTLYHARAEDILPLLEPVDCVIADPPYGDTALAWDVRVEGWLPLLNSNQLWCCGSLKFFLAERFPGWRHVQEIVWEKNNGSNFQADRFRRVHEHVVHFVREGVAWGECYHDPVYTFNGIRKNPAGKQNHTPHLRDNYPSLRKREDDKRLMRSVIALPSMNGQSVHPTQKPVNLFTPLIQYSCPPGGIVLDPFCGSGSVLVAARALGRKSIGIEVSEAYCTLTVERLRQAVLPFPPSQPVTPPEQATLFGDPP